MSPKGLHMLSHSQQAEVYHHYKIHNVPLWLIAKKYKVSLHYIIKVIHARMSRLDKMSNRTT